MKNPFCPGATDEVTVAYTVCENQLWLNWVFDGTLHVTLSAAQIRSPITPGCQGWEPSLKKIADIWPVSPAALVVKTDSPA